MKNKEYELWAMGYTADEECTDYDVCIARFPYTEQGRVNGLKALTTITIKEINEIEPTTEDVKLVSLALEEVADFSDHERAAYEVVGTRWIEVDNEED